jgi:hypothetical protein
VLLSVEGRYVALCVADLACDAKQLGRGTFFGNNGIDFTVIIEKTLQGFSIAAFVSLIGASHQQGEMLLLGFVACEVGVDAPGDVAEESLEAGWRIELFGFAGVAECGVTTFLCALAGLFGAAARSIGVVEIDFALDDARFELVELGVEDANLVEVTAFEGPELGADPGKVRFALGKPGADGSKLLAFAEKGSVVRSLMKDDLGWHAATRPSNF